MVYENVVQYSADFVRCFSAYAGECTDGGMLSALEWSLCAFERYKNGVLPGGACAGASGVNLLCGHGRRSVEEIAFAVGETCSVVGGEALGGAGESADRGSTAGRRSSDAGVVEEAVPVAEGRVGGEERKIGKWRKKNFKKKEKRRMEEAAAGMKLEEVVSDVGARADSWRRLGSVAVSGKSEAQRTLEAKWVVENKLKAFEAERKLELLKLQDVSEVAKLQERKLKAAGERAMVQIEKSHATLAATGNVPGVVPKGGYCTTLVDGPGLSDGSVPTCTISPDSSASMKEFRECQKALADAEAVIEKQRKLIRRREIMDKATYAQSVAEFTAGSESVMSDGLKRELDRKFGESYEYDGKFEGKHVVRRTYAGFEDGICDGLDDVY